MWIEREQGLLFLPLAVLKKPKLLLKLNFDHRCLGFEVPFKIKDPLFSISEFVLIVLLAEVSNC